MTTGFRILKRARVAPAEIVADFAKLPVAKVLLPPPPFMLDVRHT